jgi:hypothetical protein
MNDLEHPDVSVAEDPRQWEAARGANGTDEDRPWEAAGRVRRDCRPHRSGWLLLLGGAALLFSGLALILTGIIVYNNPGVEELQGLFRPRGWAVLLMPRWLYRLNFCELTLASVVGTALGLPARLLAGHDIRRMTGGQMDPGGLRLARRTRRYATAAMLLGVPLSLFWFALWWGVVP